MKNSRTKKTVSGFTLIEVIIVIVIAGILASISIRSLGTLSHSARTEETKQEMDHLARAIRGNEALKENGVRSDFGYVGDIGSLPPDLDALYSNPGFSNWNGPYISNRFTQITTDYKTDAWGVDYSYSGVTISSTGSGSNIVRQLAGSTNELLSNSVSGLALDNTKAAPGPDFKDSIRVELVIPDGGGNLVTIATVPNLSGYFEFSSVPIGNHDLRLIYLPTDDTLFQFLPVVPNGNVYGEYRLNFQLIGAGTPVSVSEILWPVDVGNITELVNVNCAANWNCVNESPADGNSTYVNGSGNIWLSDNYQTDDHPATTGIIDSVVVWINCLGGGAGMKAQTLVRTNGSDYSGFEINLTTASVYTVYSTGYTTNPGTALPWTWTEIDNIEIGVGLRREARCTQVWLEVFYTN